MKFWIHFALLVAPLAAVAAEIPGAKVAFGKDTVIESDTLEFVAEETVARFTFTGSVKVTATNLGVTCDRMEVISQREGGPDAAIGKMGRIREIIATGKVVISQGERKATAGRAELRPIDGVIVLSEDPLLVDPQAVMAGERITLYRGEARAHVEKPRLTINQIPDLGPGTKAEGAGTSATRTAPPAPTPAPLPKLAPGGPATQPPAPGNE